VSAASQHESCNDPRRDSILRLPAILGGEPAFAEPLPIMRPTLPAFEELAPEFEAILASGMLSNVNRYVAGFEEAAADYLGVEYTIAVSSCTSGLILAMQALELEGEIVLPSFTFSATGHAVLWNGLEPVFADCNRATHQLDPEKAEAQISERTSALLGVHMFGSPCDVERLEALAAKHGLAMIFDAAHGFGAKWKGSPVGAGGDVEVFSLSPTKVLVSAEGGMVATNDAELARKIRIGRDYGNPGNYNCEFAGLNARMSELHAALGLRSLAMLDENVAARNRLVERYKQNLATVGGMKYQEHLPEVVSTFKDFSLIIEEEALGIGRDEFAKALAAENIGSRPYFDPPLHRQDAYKTYFADADPRLPETNYVALHALSIPLFSHMSDEEVDRVCDAIVSILSRPAESAKAAAGAVAS
jgi:dTDP-4-amino-4,6-dideoxygalactose transaminase